jgi:hypothetical protein
MSLADPDWPDALTLKDVTLEGATAEERALSFIILGDRQIWLASLVLAIVGGGVSAVVSRSTGTIGRARYFLANGLLILIASLAPAAWIAAPWAIGKGYVWSLVLVWGLVQVACGFALWRLAAARSIRPEGEI